MNSSTDQPALSVRSLAKSFGGVHALRDVSLELMPGSVHGLVGENGAGKSTLIKLMTGVYQSDSGSVVFRGEKTSFSSPRAAQLAGIATIYQEVHLAPQLWWPATSSSAANPPGSGPWTRSG